MKLSLIYEKSNLTQTGTAGKIGTEVGKAALGAAADFIPGYGIAEKVGELTWKIIGLLKTRRDAEDLIMKAMSLPDSDRDTVNVFDIDDDLWGPDGILNDQSKKEIYKLVKAELDQLVAAEGTLPPNFANNIAVRYVKSKLKEGGAAGGGVNTGEPSDEDLSL